MSEDTTHSITPLPFWRAHRLIRRKVAAAAKGVGAEPAPWFSAADERDHFFPIDRLDLAATAERLIALLSGSLSGYGSVDGDWLPVPTWHWQGMHPKTMIQRWPCRLPCEWDRWRGIVVHHLDRNEFREWLRAFEPSFPDELSLPEPADPMPQFALRRELPETGTVTLGEAVSWAAWSFSLPGHEMMAAIDAGEFGPDGTRQMMAGFEKVLSKARAGELVMWGRVKSASGGISQSTQMTIGELLDFGRFNPMDESLERGGGYAWEGLSLDAVLTSDGSSFSNVSTSRDQVLAAFPPTCGPTRPTPAKVSELVEAKSPAPRRINSKSGPKRIPHAIRAECRRIFKYSTSKMAALDSRSRTALVGSLWSSPAVGGKELSPPSRGTVERYWSEWWAETH